MRKILLALLPLLIIASTLWSQPAITVYSEGYEINQAAEADSILYLATYGRGLVAYNMATGTYNTMDISNSPMMSNEVFQVQAFSGDTQLVEGGNDNWLVVNGFWTGLPDSGNCAMTNDNRIFYSEVGGWNGIYELVNGALNLLTDTILAGYRFNQVYADYHNQLYFMAEQVDSSTGNYTIFKYSNGVWNKLPLLSSSNGGQTWQGTIIFDVNDNVYAQATNGNYSNNPLYKLNSAGWTIVPLPGTGDFTITSVVPDSTGALLFFYNTYTTTDPVFTGTFVWNSVTNQTTQIQSPLVPYGVSNNIFLYNNEFFVPTWEHGLVKWNEANNTITQVDYANTCVMDYGMNLFAQGVYMGNAIVVSRGDSIFVIGGDGSLYLTDTSMNLCQNLDTNNSANLQSTSLCKDNHGNIWALQHNGTVINNLTTGASVACNISNPYFALVYDSIIWVGSPSGITQSIDNTVQFSNNFLGDYVSMDGGGNLWMDADSDIISNVYRMDKSGNIVLVKSWNYGSDYNYYTTEVTVDQLGNAWILSNDSLTRYDPNTGAATLTIIKPHTSESYGFDYFKVYDSTEMVLISYTDIEYFKNGTWSYYDTKFDVAYMPYVFSFHDHRLIFFTDFDGIIEYNLDGNFDNSGDHVGGIVFHDLNDNHIQDSLDVGFNGVPVSVNNNICSSNSFGQYGLDVAGGNYTIKLQTPPYYVSYPDSYSVTLNNTDMDTLNFACYAPQQVNDLKLSITADDFVIGYGGDFFINVRNNGTNVVTPTVTVNYDPSLQLTFIQTPVISQSPGTVTLQLTPIYPLEECNALLAFEGPMNVDSAVWVHFQATAYPLAGDSTPANNTDTTSIFTLGSFDPNYKTVQPQGAGFYNSVDTNQVLTYTIGFQNTGTAQAINITLVDTLDKGLDPSTFKYIACSLPNTYQIWGHTLTVTMKNANLPDSTANPVGSVGYFKFSISAQHPVQINQPVVNTAAIYFDFNSPVVTNSTMVSFGPVVYSSISDVGGAAGSVLLWPQPCSDELNIWLSQQVQLPATMKIFNLNGQLVVSESLESNYEKVAMDNLSSGIYIVSIQDGDNKFYRSKCVKVR